MIDDGMTPALAAYVATRGHSGNFKDLSADEVRAMDWAEYCRRTGRDKTPAQMALDAHQAAQETVSATSVGNEQDLTRNAPEVTYEAAPGLSLEECALQSPEGFAEWRSQRKSNGEGVGIFAGVGSQSQEYRQAAAARAGRNALVQSNVTGPAVPMSREQMVANMRASEAAQLDNRVNRFRGWSR